MISVEISGSLILRNLLLHQPTRGENIICANGFAATT